MKENKLNFILAMALSLLIVGEAFICGYGVMYNTNGIDTIFVLFFTLVFAIFMIVLAIFSFVFSLLTLLAKKIFYLIFMFAVYLIHIFNISILYSFFIYVEWFYQILFILISVGAIVLIIISMKLTFRIFKENTQFTENNEIKNDIDYESDQQEIQ